MITILNYHHSLTCLSLTLIITFIFFILENLNFNHPYINGCLLHPSIGLGSSSGAFNSLALIRRMPSESKVLAQFLMAGTGELRHFFDWSRLSGFFGVYNLYPSCVSIFPILEEINSDSSISQWDFFRTRLGIYIHISLNIIYCNHNVWGLMGFYRLSWPSWVLGVLPHTEKTTKWIQMAVLVKNTMINQWKYRDTTWLID